MLPSSILSQAQPSTQLEPDPGLEAAQQAAQQRGRRLEAAVVAAPLVVYANLACAAVAVCGLWPWVSHGLLLGWTVTLVITASRGLPLWNLYRLGRLRSTASPRVLTRIVVHAGWTALLWAALTAGAAPHVPAATQHLLWACIFGLLGCSGLFLLSVPRAAVLFDVVVGAGGLVGMYTVGTPAVLLLALLVYGTIALWGVWLLNRHFEHRMLVEAQARQQGHLVEMLLRDLEESANAVRWETDTQGHFRNVNNRLARALATQPQALEGEPLTAVLQRLQPGRVADRAQRIDALQRRLDTGLPFRDQIVQFMIGKHRRWWSLSARPITNAQGDFTGWRGVASDVTATHEAYQRIAALARTDALTELPNRRAFAAAVGEALNPPSSTGDGKGFAVLFLDLDRFKNTNDTLGHAAGDALIKEVASRLRRAVRPDDAVARFGGDEFAVLLAGADDEPEVVERARALLATVRQPFDYHGASVSVRASVGMALAPRDGTDLESLLTHADLALHETKRLGGNALRFFQPPMAAVMVRRMQVEQALRDALVQRQFQLVYQPQVDLPTWNIVGCEALLRWRHPELGDVSPAEFIPVAEETGLIRAIGEWALREACRQAARWPGKLTVAVNVSPVQAMSPSLVGAVAEALVLADLPPERLEIEITESVFIDESQVALEVLAGIQNLGVKIALDDFGTGYASLAYLRRFPFDKLKIDRSFVTEMKHHHDARAIVRNVLHLAQSLEMTTIAEGVEDPKEVQLLERHGCAMIQGFYVSEPMSAAALTEFLHQWHQDNRPELVPGSYETVFPDLQ